MLHFLTDHGLPLLFIAILLESFGVPLPGETALIAFAVLAAQGHYHIQWVIAVAAAGAILGDNLGFWLIGRKGGRALFKRWKWLQKYSEHVLPRAEKLMAQHGGKTVFFGRFVSVLRYTAAWVAGLGGMPWGKFLFWNATGGICWATLVGLVTYYAGQAAADAIAKYGIIAAIVVGVIVLGIWFIVRRAEHSFSEPDSE